MMQTPRNAIILYPLHYMLYTYKSNTIYKYETGKMRFELTDREYLYGRIAIDFTLPTDDLPQHFPSASSKYRNNSKTYRKYTKFNQVLADSNCRPFS